MAINIYDIPIKTNINCSLQSKSLLIVGKSKSGKSTLAAQAPRPIFLATENGMENLTGITPVPIGSWSDFTNAVRQLCMPQGRQSFDTVVIDTYTNLILLLDKYCGSQMSTDKESLDFSSDADYGKGTKKMRNELGIQLQKLANQGYLLLNIVHAEDKVDFKTQKSYIGTSLSNSLYGLAEKFIDNIVYLERKVDKQQNIIHQIHYNSKCGFAAGGRFTTDVDSSNCSFKDLEEVMIRAMEKSAKSQGASTEIMEKPAIVISNDEDRYDFLALMEEFKVLTSKMVSEDENNAPTIIRTIVEKELGAGRKVSGLNVNQVELLVNILDNLKSLNEKGENN